MVSGAIGALYLGTAVCVGVGVAAGVAGLEGDLGPTIG